MLCGDVRSLKVLCGDVRTLIALCGDVRFLIVLCGDAYDNIEAGYIKQLGRQSCWVLVYIMPERQAY